jgi:cation diffusion facilitator CzcD-associated flavoprotein CzcO
VQIRDNPPTTEAERVRVNDPLEYPRLQRELWNAYSESDRWRLVPGAQRDAMERQFRGFLETVRDPELRQKLTPQYNLGCTRIPKSDRYYEAVQRPNVRIETTGIECIVPEGVRLKDGTTVELDVIVYATGFDAHAYMRPMTVVGLDGLTVGELWKDGVFSYRGVGLPGFPNLFMLYGPFSPVNNVSVPLGLEQEIDYILRIVSIARKRGAAVMPTLDATRRFVDRMRRSMPGTVWVGCRNWYSDRGLPILWPLPQDDHAALLAEVDVDELEFVSA